MLKKLNDIRTGSAAMFADPFRGEKRTTSKPYVERTIPEHPVWMEQPEPGYDKDWWIYRSGGSKPVDHIIVGLLIVSFVIMAVLA